MIPKSIEVLRKRTLTAIFNCIASLEGIKGLYATCTKAADLKDTDTRIASFNLETGALTENLKLSACIVKDAQSVLVIKYYLYAVRRLRKDIKQVMPGAMVTLAFAVQKIEQEKTCQQ